MPTQYPETLSTAEINSAANRQPTGGQEFRPNGEEVRQPVASPPPPNAAAENGPLLPENFTQECRTKWDGVQAGFVDEPRSTVQKADELVADAIKKLAETFAAERNKLEQQWDRGDNVNTEDLRVSLQKYRSFFNRLLAV